MECPLSWFLTFILLFWDLLKQSFGEKQIIGKIFCALMRQNWTFLEVCVPLQLCKANKAFQIKIIIPTVKCGGAVTDGTLNSALYHKILEDNVQPSENDSTKKTVSNLLHSNMNDSFVLIVAKTWLEFFKDGNYFFTQWNSDSTNEISI